MTTVKYFGIESDFDIYGNELVFGSFVSASDETYIYNSQDGERVTLTGESIVIDGSNRFVSGVITDIKLSGELDQPGNGSASDVNIRVEEIRLDGTEILGSGGASTPSNEEAWAAVLKGDVKLITRSTETFYMGLDGSQLSAPGIYEGGDNSYAGDIGGINSLDGGFTTVRSTAVFKGGTFTFEGQASYVAGDAFTSRNTAIVIGGNDKLTYVNSTENPNLVRNVSEVVWSGDVQEAYDSSTVIGGNDLLDLRQLVHDNDIFIYGDAGDTEPNATVIGGDDIIRGAIRSENTISGDADAVGAAQQFAGGNDVIRGGNKADMLYGDHLGDTNGRAGGNDFIYGGDGADSIFGNGGNDRLFDKLGNGRIFGGDGNDRFTQTANGAHNFNGGDGFDIIDYSESAEKVIIDLDDQTVTGGWGDNDTFSNVEGARGSRKGDTIYGTDGSDKLFGDNGNDSLVGRGGGDELYAGKGQDQLVGTSGLDSYYGGNGFDVLDYRNSNEGIRAFLDTGVFTGGHAQDDVVTGVENIFATDFDDRIRGDDARNTLRGRDGDDNVRGERGSDLLQGQDGEDMLFGGRGADGLYGGTNSDTLFGGTGSDVMVGEGGADVFHFKRGDDYDRITDFQNNNDTLRLEGVGKNAINKAQKVGNDVYIDFGRGDQLYIDDITINQLRNDIDYV